MKIAAIGAGAIGSVGGGLLARAGEDVTLIARQPHVDAVDANGLLIEGVLGSVAVAVRAGERLDFKPDLVLLTAKTQAVATAAHEIEPYVIGVPVVTMRHGVRSDELVADMLGKVALTASSVAVHGTAANAAERRRSSSIPSTLNPRAPPTPRPSRPRRPRPGSECGTGRP